LPTERVRCFRRAKTLRSWAPARSAGTIPTMHQGFPRGAACLAGWLLVIGTARAQDAAPAAEPSAASASESAAAPATASPTSDPVPTVTTGSSRSGMARARCSRRVVTRVDVSKPIATYPGFRMLRGGRSEVWLRVSQPVMVKEKRSRRRVVYFMPSVQVGVRNNTNPLVTTHFNSPISQARLRPVRGGAELVVDLREAVQPEHATAQEPGGAMLLRVTVGKTARDYASESKPPVLRASAGRSAPNAVNGATAHRRAPPIMVLPEVGPQP
jgi:hypothetical protein